MPPLIALWRSRRHKRRPASAPNVPLTSNTSPLHSKIHADLDALVAQVDGSHPDNSSPRMDLPSTMSSGHNFLPLKPRARERPCSEPPELTPLSPMAESPENTVTNAHMTTSSPDDAWSTFGRGRNIFAHAPACSLISVPGTPELPKNAQTRTPTSQSTGGSSSVSRSTQTRNRSSPSSHNEMVSTPRRPGRHSSPLSYHTFGRQSSPPHMPIESPPPLPPLAHPAFQSLTSGTHTLCSAASNVSYAGVPQKYPRHYVSLPSMSTAKLQTVSAYRETSSSHQNEPSGTGNTRVLRQANRLDRRSCRNSNRRSGAEHSSRKTIETNAQAVGRWEAQVRDAFPKKEMPILGNACGNNVPCRQVLKLGNPFLFQDTNCHIAPWPGDNNDFPFTHDITISEKGKTKSNEMIQSDAPTHHQSKDKDKGASPPTKSNRRQAIPPNRAHHAATRNIISQSASESLLVPPMLSLTSPTPEISPVLLFSPSQSPASFSGTNLTTLPLKSTIARTSGKRKADEADVEATPSKKATFAPDQRPHRVSENSGSSYAPSSYRHKRLRLSTSSDSRNLSRSPTVSSLKENLNTGNTGSLSSRASTRGQSLAYHHTSRQLMHAQRHLRESSRRQSLSGASIPISALVSPHAPSIDRRKTFHMHDPRKPGPTQRTSWMLSLPSSGAGVGSRWVLNSWVERGGSPLHAWMFFLGFLFFPVWWLAAFIGTPKTRRIGGGETEKGVVLDDPQVEHDSKSWRTRCRVMSVISFLTYIPFIVLVAVFARP